MATCAPPGEAAAPRAVFEAPGPPPPRLPRDSPLASPPAGRRPRPSPRSSRRLPPSAPGSSTTTCSLPPQPDAARSCSWPQAWTPVPTGSDGQPAPRRSRSTNPTYWPSKNAVLNSRGAVPRCDRAALAADLREDWTGTLLGSGLRPTERTAWLAEGLLIYLTAEEADRLLTATTGLSAPGSRIAFEYADSRSDNTGASDGGPVGRGLVRPMPGMSRITALWKGGLGADTPDWLAGHGWQVQTPPIGPVAAAYNRQIPGRASGRFVTASRGPRIP